MRSRTSLILLACLASLPQLGHATIPWPVGNSTVVSTITATFGQYRDNAIAACPGGIACKHFQRGLGLAPGTGSTVSTLVAGHVKEINTSAPSEPLISVSGTNGAIVTYRYVTAAEDLSQGSTVTLLQAIGAASSTKVEIEIEKSAGTWCNPMFDCMGLFAGYNPPPDQHPSIDRPILLDANTGAQINISTPIGRRHFSILANIAGTVYQPNLPPPPNVGVNMVGYYIEPLMLSTQASTGDTGTFEPYPITQEYQTIDSNKLFNIGVPYSTSRSTEGGPFSYIATNFVRGTSMVTGFASNNFQDGLWNICVRAGGVRENRYATNCSTVTFDRSAPTIDLLDENEAPITTGASSMTAVRVIGNDFFGLASIALAGPTASSHAVSGNSASFVFTGLSDGEYTATITDLAGNVSNSVKIIIDTVSPGTPNPQNPSGEALYSVFPATNQVVAPGTDSGSGICKTIFTGPVNSSTFSFSGAPGTSLAGPVSVSSGNLNITYVDCAGNRSATNSTVTTGTIGMQLCANGGGFTSECQLVQTPNIDNAMIADGTAIITLKSKAVGGCNGSNIAAMCEMMVPTCNVIESCHCTDQATIVCSANTLGGAVSIQNTSSNTSLQGLHASLDLTSTHGNAGVGVQKDSAGGFSLGSGSSIDLTFSLSNAGQKTPITDAESGFSLLSYIKNLFIQAAALIDNLRQSATNMVMSPVGTPGNIHGSVFLFASTTTVNISTGLPSGIEIDTTTLAIYSYDGGSWSSAPVTNQFLSINGNVVTATGSIQGSGIYGLFFVGTDTTPPLTSLHIQGSSFTFDQAIFASTDAFAVLGATDPAVNGFASTVASVTYRLDPATDSPFNIYATSLPLPLGTHVLEYRSWDYAGNAEPVKTATFTVTAGSAMRTSSSARVPGVLLNGFLGSGAKLEIESRAEESLTLLISSANREGMVAVDNIGEVGIGVTPRANLNIGAGAVGLQLRSGNSSSAVTSNQIAFGYNGDYSMRHLLRTEHSTSTDGNKLDFLVWNPGAGSTTTLASLNVLSLQGIASASGGSFHVQPVGEPDAEVEVSNGLSTGGGTMQRLQVVAPSSRRFKTDIKDLSEKDEDRALEDIAGLKHARFRYKSRQKDGRLTEDPAQTFHTGLIYEEAPESIREGREALSTSERLVNVELALKAEMRKLEELQKRYEKLKARRTTP